jgi:hypothetical protein
VEELQNAIKRQQDAVQAEKSTWETERHRLVAERLRLIQENESLRRESGSRPEPRTPVNKGRSSLSGEITTDSIMRAIEADLKKAKGGNKQSLPDDSWTVSDSTAKSPLKRAAVASRPSSKKKKVSLNSSSLVHESPLKAQVGNSELDFWAFAK